MEVWDMYKLQLKIITDFGGKLVTNTFDIDPVKLNGIRSILARETLELSDILNRQYEDDDFTEI